MAILQKIFSGSNRKSIFLTGVQSALILVTLTCLVSPLKSQSLAGESNKFSFDVYGGAGITTLGPGTTAGVTFMKGGHQFNVRGISTDLKPADETWEIAVLYGRVIRSRAFQFSAGAGVGVVGGTGYTQLFTTGSRERLETMIGFPLEGRITWKPVRQAGLGLQTFANVNTVQPFAGMAVTFHLGF